MCIAELVQDEHLWLKSIYFFFFRKWLIVSLDKTLIPQLGLCKALWSCNSNLDLQPVGPHWSSLYGEKSWNVFLKTFISIRLKKVLNDWRPVALTPIFSKCFEKLIRDYICSVLPASLDPLQFAYRSNRSDDAITFTLQVCLIVHCVYWVYSMYVYIAHCHLYKSVSM